MGEHNQDSLSSKMQDIDYYCIFRDVMKNLWVILLGAVGIALLVNVYTDMTSRTSYTYTTKATFVVSTRGTANKVYNNLSSAQSMATTLSNVLNSSIIQKKVCEDLDIPSFDAQASARVIDETNLLELKVTAKNAKLAYQICRSIMKNYPEITDSVIGSTMMETLQEPSVPLRPNYEVNVKKETEKGFLIGFAVMAVLVILSSYMNDTIKNSKDLANKLEAQPLGTIYYEKKNKSLFSMLKRKKSSLLITDPTTSFGFVESNQKIAVKLAHKKNPEKGMVINVTSVAENEGKSTLTANLALSYARNHDRVLVIDCDLRKPSQHLIFQKKEDVEYELKDVLEGNCALEDAWVKDEDKNLWHLFSTRYYQDCSEIIASRNMQILLEKLRDKFDYIILDAPPFSVSSDAEILADHADSTVLIVKYNKLQARDINDAIDELSSCKSELAGCILNQARTMPHLGGNHSYGYGYGYGKYYHYNKK